MSVPDKMQLALENIVSTIDQFYKVLLNWSLTFVFIKMCFNNYNIMTNKIIKSNSTNNNNRNTNYRNI